MYYNKSTQVEKAYSKINLQTIDKVFTELKEMSKYKEAKEYVQQVKARLKA